MKRFLPLYIILLTVAFVITQKLTAQQMLRAASWKYQGGELMRGQVISPDQLWDAENYVLIKQNRGYRREKVGGLAWLAVGQDTIWRNQTDLQPLSGHWQLLVGGAYNLYVQRKDIHATVQVRTGIAPVDWLVLAFGNRNSYRYALQYKGQWVSVDYRYPLRQLDNRAPTSCSLPRQHPYFPSRRKIWQIGKALNNCSLEGTTYEHPYNGPRWEFRMSTILATPGRQAGEETRSCWGGRVGAAKPLPILSKHLAAEVDFTWFAYRQSHNLWVTNTNSPGAINPYYRLSAAAPSGETNYETTTFLQNRLLSLGVRYELAPTANISMTLAGGAAMFYENKFMLNGKLKSGYFLPTFPFEVKVREQIPGGVFPYAAIGFRARLRYDWRLGLRIRYDPVFERYYSYFPEKQFITVLSEYTQKQMDAAFAVGIELVLAKLVF